MKIAMGKKLILCFGLLVAVVIGLGISTFVLTMKMSRSFDMAVNVNTRKSILVGKMNLGKSDMRTAQRGTVMFTFADAPDKAEKCRKDFYASAEAATNALSELEGLLTREDGKQITRAIREDIGAWTRGFNDAYVLLLQGRPKEADAMVYQKTTPVMDDLAKQTAKLAAIQENITKGDALIAKSQSDLSTLLASVSILFGGIIGVIAFIVVRGISKQVEKITLQLGEGSGQVASAAGEISSASQTLAQGSSEQAATLQQTASSISEISSMTEKNAANAKAAAALTMEAAKEIDRGYQKLEEMVTATASINESSTKVSKILKVIDEIAFQTNILALNAAVEAARAGEAGSGFAVVADEVRNLAQRCAQAANDTATLVEESLSKSKEGQIKVEEVSHAITAITEKSNQIRILVDEVSVASQEQSKGLHNISQSVMQIEEVTQRNAASAEEGAAGGEELSSQSEVLRRIVADLETLVRGKSEKQEVTPVKSPRAPRNTMTLSSKPLNAITAKVPDHAAFPMDEEDAHKFFVNQ